MHFERHAREILVTGIDKTELNGLFAQRRILAAQSIDSGADHSVQITIIENRIKTLLCLA